MQQPPHKNPGCRAKPRRETRPHYGMPSSIAALAGLGVIWAIAGCFNVNNYANCRIICSADDQCPSGLTCDTAHGLCAPRGDTCADTTDAGTDADAMEAGADATDAMDTGTDGTDGDGGSGPPEVLCHAFNGVDKCLPLPEAVRANLVLLLWPSNLPAVGSTVDVWKDQSGQGNDAHAIYPSALPQVIASGVKLDSNQQGSGFEVWDSPSLDFGSGDFAVIVVAGLAASNRDVAFFNKVDGAFSGRQVSLRWSLSSITTGGPRGYVNDIVLTSPLDTPQPSVAVYDLRRRRERVELRLNNAVVIGADFPAGSSTASSEDVFLGTGSPVSNVADSISAVIVVRGPIAETDLDNLESFLAMFAMGPV